MTLEEKHEQERKSLELLCNALDERVHDYQSLIKVLQAAQDFQKLE